MHVAIVYDSRTGTTRRVAEAMAEVVRAAGHACTVQPVQQADPTQVGRADALCVGSWTQGLFFFLQHPTRATMAFLDRLGPLTGKPAAVFCTYKTSPGSLLVTLADRLRRRGASVTGEFRSRGPALPSDFEQWVASLATAETLAH